MLSPEIDQKYEHLVSQDTDVNLNTPRSTEEFLINLGLYRPSEGEVTIDKTKSVEGGELLVSSYLSNVADHRIGVYTPDDYDDRSPTIIMNTALGTGGRGHNQVVAESMMRRGYRVFVKGPPRYKSPTLRALTLTQDVNETFSAFGHFEANGVINNSPDVFIYGESQGAMKGLGSLAIASSYSKTVVDALLVAPCYLRKINYYRPEKQLFRLGSMILSGVNYALRENNAELIKRRGTFAIKDLHHHAITIPVLASGEAGNFLQHIDEAQKFTVAFFDRDGHSKPRRASHEIQTLFPNSNVVVFNDLGHIDGIGSDEIRSLRDVVLFELKKSLAN